MPTHYGWLPSRGLSKEASRCRIEKLLQVDIHHVAVALLNVGLGLGDRLVGGPSWPKAIAERGKRGVPPPLQHLQHRLLDQPVKHARNAQFAFLAASWLGDSTRLISWGWYVPWSNCSLIASQCALRKAGSSSTCIASMPGAPLFALTCWSAARMLPRSHSSSMRYSPNLGRSVGCLAGSASTLAPGPRGFTPASQ